MRLPFGKYRGRDVADVPLSYLEYLLQWDELHDDLREEINQEIAAYKAVVCIYIPELFTEETGITLRDMKVLQKANLPLRRRAQSDPDQSAAEKEEAAV